MNIVEFPAASVVLSIPDSLRRLAERIEQAEFGEAHNLVWAVDCGSGKVEVGLLGPSSGEPGPHAYLLLGLAQRRLETSPS